MPGPIYWVHVTFSGTLSKPLACSLSGFQFQASVMGDGVARTLEQNILCCVFGHVAPAAASDSVHRRCCHIADTLLGPVDRARFFCSSGAMRSLSYTIGGICPWGGLTPSGIANALLLAPVTLDFVVKWHVW